MEFKTIVVKLKSENEEVVSFDAQINQLVEEGYRLDKRIVVPTEEELFLVAFLSKREKRYNKRDQKRDKPVEVEEKTEPVEEPTPD